MAHLIKLEDYTSRYQQDIQRYLSQFSRLKKERWENMKRDWIKANRKMDETAEETLDDWLEERENGIIHAAVNRLKNFSGRQRWNEKTMEIEMEDELMFYEGKTLDEVKELFFEDLFSAQLRWASASMLEESRMDPKYKYDQTLRFLVRQLPDNYMIMYYPVFSVGKAPLEMDIIILAPTEVYCLTMLTGETNSVFETSSGRYWNEYVHQSRNRRVNPVLSLNRMSSVINSLFKEHSSSLDVRRVVWAPSSIIDHRAAGMKAEMVDKRNHQEWFDKRKKNPSPVKKNQLYAAELFLQQTQTTSFRRRDFMEEE
ncbi:nuclease-related domain-containing protein [Salibacterium aidingense]|uniref:nuclease-related domain-containing protein n=1 Tax=Salibacterium aidingense TaxID=384933 RepID=UPI0004085BEE|nr:nuclease-related domain-containing protein [Salibacterium aidingense]